MTTPTPRWTAETEELVARAVGDPGSVCSRAYGEPIARWSAHAVLSLLDAQGLLVPVSGEAQQQDGYQAAIDLLRNVAEDFADGAANLLELMRRREVTDDPA